MEPVARREAWRVLHARALADGHPEPEKFAETALRNRERSLQLQSKRPSTLLIQKAPPAEPPKQGGKAPVARCKAKTLEGKPCSFAATCGAFCKRHLPKKPAWSKVDQQQVEGVGLKGMLCVPRARACKVFGASHPSPDEETDLCWNLRIGGVLARVYYHKDDPQLHVGGHTMEAVAQARTLLLD